MLDIDDNFQSLTPVPLNKDQAKEDKNNEKGDQHESGSEEDPLDKDYQQSDEESPQDGIQIYQV